MYTHSKCSLIKVKVLLKRLIIVIICPRSHENILKEGERNSLHTNTLKMLDYLALIVCRVC